MLSEPELRQLKGAIAGLLGFAAAEEQVLLATVPPDESGSPQNWAAVPLVAHNTEFKSQQVRRLRAISQAEVPEDFAEVDHTSGALYLGYAARDAGRVAAGSNRVTGDLIDGLKQVSAEDLVDPARHPWLRGRQLWLQVIVRGFWHPAGHLADYYLGHGQPDRSVALAAHAVATARYLAVPDEVRGMASYNLACAQARAGHLDDAAAAVRESAALNPGLRGKIGTEPDLAVLRTAGGLRPRACPDPGRPGGWQDGGVPAYAAFAAFYDQIMGDRRADIQRVKVYIERYQPHACSLLELGCGTGAMLAGLAPGLAVTGVDQSPEMLAMAAGKVPAARLVQADMSKFSLGTRFDVAICVFDTLNHLPGFASWRETFDRVHEHLADDGLFVFDVNTTGRLRKLWPGPAFAADFGANTMIMDVLPAGRAADEPGEMSIWTVRIFERVAGDMFRLHTERIPELGVPLAAIRDALSPHFELLDATGLGGEPATDESDRAFFACRHRSQD